MILAALLHHAAIVAIAVAGWLLLRERGPAVALSALLLTAFSVPLLVAARALGRALAGWAVGFQVLHVNLVFFEFRREFGEWTVDWTRPRSMDGFAVAAPLRAEGLRWRGWIHDAGGPLTNLVVAGGCLFGAWWTQGLRVRSWPEPLTLLWPAGFVSGMFVMGLFANLAILFAPRERGGLDHGLAGLRALGRYGTRPRDWPAELAKHCLWEGELGKCPPEGHLLAYWHALDQGDIKRARERLGLALAQVADADQWRQAPFQVEGAYVAGVYDYDADLARRRMEGVPRGAVEEHTDRRGLAAAAYAARDYPRARGAAEAALDALKKSKELGFRECERDLLMDLLDRCDRLA